ncbi:Tryptophan/tyrosine permease [Scenedesmus sp. NREL 46B-D3]|nr:Tryptophan/tyrosine permease [Scenedesmus sp. NREL 46B-D3]
MFSNLDRDLKHDPGSVFGSAMLVAGTTVGAGERAWRALPAVTQDAGFVPSAATLTLVCLFSAATGLLVAEVNLGVMRRQGAGGLSVITMARATLGEQGALASSAAYVFLHYALLVAYMSKAGEILAGAAGVGLVPGAAAFAAAFALLCYGSSQKLLDRLNSVLVGLVVASFLGLLVVAAAGVDVGSITSGGDWGAVPGTLPVVALAFVYHNIIPVVCTALEGDAAKIRAAVLAGLAIPWAMFVAWDGAVLGSLDSLRAATSPPAGAADPLAALSAANPAAAPLIQGFSFLAIATSYIGFILGLTDFLADALALPTGRQAPLPYLLALLPTFVVAVTNPNIFLQALDTAGTYGVLTLFGIQPAAMAWNARYSSSSMPQSQQLVPGGKAALLSIGGAAAGVILNEMLQLSTKN